MCCLLTVVVPFVVDIGGFVIGVAAAVLVLIVHFMCRHLLRRCSPLIVCFTTRRKATAIVNAHYQILTLQRLG